MLTSVAEMEGMMTFEKYNLIAPRMSSFSTSKDPKHISM